LADLLDHDETTKWLEGDYKLHYHEAGDGPPFILLHGSGPGVSGWSNFQGNFPVFAKEFRTFILDMPGFGMSEAPKFDKVYPKVAADALIRFMDGVGLEKAHLLGNSMGGYVAAEAALSYPDRIDRMVMMGPGGLAVNVFSPDGSEGGKRLFEFMANPTREGMVAWVDCMVGDKSVISDALIDMRMKNALVPGKIEAVRAIFATLGQFPNDNPPWKNAEKITHPTLITWGRDDRMLPYDGAVFAFRRMPNAELHIFSRCGHWAQIERKDEFERLVIEFLTR